VHAHHCHYHGRHDACCAKWRQEPERHKNASAEFGQAGGRGKKDSGSKTNHFKHASCCFQAVPGESEQFPCAMSGYSETKKQSDDEYRSIHKISFLGLFRS
jgi:hypothetical protein